MDEKKQVTILVVAALFFFSFVIGYNVFFVSPINVYQIQEDTAAVYETGSETQSGTAVAASEEGKLNINTASSTELTKLPGIGAVIADRIVAYREENGDFDSIQDLKLVNGIGETKFNLIQDIITTE